MHVFIYVLFHFTVILTTSTTNVPSKSIFPMQKNIHSIYVINLDEVVLLLLMLLMLFLLLLLLVVMWLQLLLLFLVTGHFLLLLSRSENKTSARMHAYAHKSKKRACRTSERSRKTLSTTCMYLFSV